MFCTSTSRNWRVVLHWRRTLKAFGADHDDESFDEGLFLDNEVVQSSSTSTHDKEANSSSDRDSCKIGTSTIGINLEVALEIDHEDLYANITSAS